ncbi:GntR family transcriptional regulator [Methylobacterium sp. E-065]|uniref:GntR family transcriptional regulator n=1 Tax=Methylobacterium sp. E-065 TaxID=2836583 RepID=UPI001FB98E71|nr:GntR family transcriptional regulator [Methylobacterium sp. E-065]MCJ2016705.1 GntR family transcriptional regulator [Methylobacterium sp. E-065]
MTYADEIRRQVEVAPRAALPAVTAALWRAYGAGQVTEAEAEALSSLIEARQVKNATLAGLPLTDTLQDRQSSPRRPGVGSRPRTGASMERRRRWASSGRLPPAIAARFTLAEQGVLSLVAAEVARRKDCRLAVGHLASIVGVAETTVRNAIREAVKLGLVTVEERRVTGFRNDTNIVRIVSAEWTAWLRLARKGVPKLGETSNVSEGGGCKSPKGTPTEVPDLGKSRPAEAEKGCRGAAGDLDRSGPVRILAGGRTGRAMR